MKHIGSSVRRTRSRRHRAALAAAVLAAGVPAAAYEGESPDASWRAAAAHRIDQHRKSDLQVRVLDEEGRPVRGATVDVQMTDHAFAFGSTIDLHAFYGWELNGRNYAPDAECYRTEFLRLFRNATVSLRWAQYASGTGSVLDRRFEQMDWLTDHGIDYRGHVVAYRVPTWLDDLRGEELLQAWKSHATTMLTDPRVASRIREWDILNEPYAGSHHAWRLSGEQRADLVRHITGLLDPAVKTYINEARITSQLHQSDTRDDLGDREDWYYRFLQDSISEGIEFDGIGLQGHHGGNPEQLTSIPEVIRIFDRFAGLGKVMKITEFDIKLGSDPSDKANQQLAAQYMRDYMTAVFAEPAMEGLTIWGFWDGRHWKDDAPFFEDDWTAKPALDVWLDLVFDEWWTREQLRTDALGAAMLRGFHGDYDVTVTVNGEVLTQSLSLGPDGNSVTFGVSTPEPSTFALLAVGSVGIMGIGRHRRGRTAGAR